MRVGVVIGHKVTSPGACNKDMGICEFEFNDWIAEDIKRSFTSTDNIDVKLIYRTSYSKLPKEINALDCDIIISLHCNAFNTLAHGCETLYYHKSKKGYKIAKILNNNFVDALGLTDRGVKPKTSEDRGGYLLRTTNAPCVICEPFFIDNTNEFKMVIALKSEIVKAYVKSIYEIQDKMF